MLLLIRTVLILCLSFAASAKPFISYTALGDSYPASLGVGSSFLCGGFPDAYPVQVAHHLTLAFRNLACAGASTSTVLWTQVPWIGHTDIVTLEVGGNEANFFALLNECIQQWKPISTCELEVARAKSIIESASFIERFDNLIYRTKKHVGADTTLLVLGYARFFNDESDQCDRITFSRTDPLNFLTQEKRRMFNQILSMLNTVIKGAAQAHGAVYFDVDKVFEGHRFCEGGVEEPSSSASWFFNDVDATPEDIMASGADPNVITTSLDDFLHLTRTFHPTAAGHAAIADAIVLLLQNL